MIMKISCDETQMMGYSIEMMDDFVWNLYLLHREGNNMCLKLLS